MMLYYQTKFSCERTSSLENTIKIVSPCCDLDRERSNHFSPQDTQAYYAVLSNKVWLQTDQQFRRYSENSHILIVSSPCCNLDTEDSESIFFCMTDHHMITRHLTKFGTKWLSG